MENGHLTVNVAQQLGMKTIAIPHSLLTALTLLRNTSGKGEENERKCSNYSK